MEWNIMVNIVTSSNSYTITLWYILETENPGCVERLHVRSIWNWEWDQTRKCYIASPFYNIHRRTAQSFRVKRIWVSNRCTLYGCTKFCIWFVTLWTALYGLQIYICEEFGKKYGIKYNPKKSKCMKIGSNYHS